MEETVCPGNAAQAACITGHPGESFGLLQSFPIHIVSPIILKEKSLRYSYYNNNPPSDFCVSSIAGRHIVIALAIVVVVVVCVGVGGGVVVVRFSG